MRYISVAKIRVEGTNTGTALSQRLVRWRIKEVKAILQSQSTSDSISTTQQVSSAASNVFFSSENSLSAQMNSASATPYPTIDSQLYPIIAN